MNLKWFLLKYLVIQKRCPGTYSAHRNCLARAAPQLDFILNRLMSTLFKTIAATLFTDYNIKNKFSFAKRRCTKYFIEFGKCVNMENLFLRKKQKRLKCGSLQSQIGERWKRKEKETCFPSSVQTAKLICLFPFKNQQISSVEETQFCCWLKFPQTDWAADKRGLKAKRSLDWTTLWLFVSFFFWSTLWLLGQKCNF